MTVPADRTKNNFTDTGRKWPTTALAERVLTAKEGSVRELLAGTNMTPIALQEPICPNTAVHALAFVTATGAPAAKTLLQAPTDFTVVNSNANGVGTITPAADQSANTLLIFYSPDQAEGTIGGQSSAT